MCRGSPLEGVQHVWAARHDDPRVLLEHWTTEFLSAFDATHPPSPAERAAAILRGRFAHPPSLDALALESGSCRSGLTRSFRLHYGISCSEYLTRVRLRRFIYDVRSPGANAGRLGEEVGYRRYHNLLSAQRLRTGLTPSEVRRLTDDEMRELVDAKLALSGTAAGV